MKLALALLLPAALVLAACNTNATRRDLYSPAKPTGPYSQALKDQTWDRGVKEKRKPKTLAKATPAPGVNAAPSATVPASSATLPR